MAMLNNQRVPAINMASLWSDGSDLRLSECNRVVPGSRPKMLKTGSWWKLLWKPPAKRSFRGWENHGKPTNFAILSYWGKKHPALIIGDFSIVWVPFGAQQLAIGKFCETFGSCCDTAGFCYLESDWWDWIQKNNLLDDLQMFWCYEMLWMQNRDTMLLMFNCGDSATWSLLTTLFYPKSRG